MAVIESGTTVRIRIGDQEECWTVVAPHEADYLKRRISELSPLGFALLGRQPGQSFTVPSPRPYRVTVVAIEVAPVPG